MTRCMVTRVSWNRTAAEPNTFAPPLPGATLERVNGVAGDGSPVEVMAWCVDVTTLADVLALYDQADEDILISRYVYNRDMPLLQIVDDYLG